MDGVPPYGAPRAYLLHIPSWVLGWHLTLAALHASQALVMRGALGVGTGAAAAGAGSPIVSMLSTCVSAQKKQNKIVVGEPLGVPREGGFTGSAELVRHKARVSCDRVRMAGSRPRCVSAIGRRVRAKDRMALPGRVRSAEEWGGRRLGLRRNTEVKNGRRSGADSAVRQPRCIHSLRLSNPTPQVALD